MALTYLMVLVLAWAMVQLLDEKAEDEALPIFREALTIAREIESIPDLLDALAGLGEIFLKQGDQKRVIPILQFVSHHPVTQTLARQRTVSLLGQNIEPPKSHLPADKMMVEAIIELTQELNR